MSKQASDIIETEFYSARLSFQKMDEGQHWLCRVRVNRKDFCESVGGFNVHGDSVAEVEKEAKVRMRKLLANLEKPADWKSPIRKAQVLYRNLLENEANSFALLKQCQNLDEVAVLFRQVLDARQSDTLSLVKQILLLEEDELIQLIGMGDLINIDLKDEEMQSLAREKIEIFQYIPAPSRALSDAYELLLEKTNRM